MTRSETNAWLKALYEALGPEFFSLQAWDFMKHEWFDVGGVGALSSHLEYRLRPIVPDGCEPIPDDAYVYGPDRRGAVCLVGRQETNGRSLRGWACDMNPADGRSDWHHDGGRHGHWTASQRGCEQVAYLLDLSDPNAPDIVRRNTGKRLPWDDTGKHQTEPPPEIKESLDAALTDSAEHITDGYLVSEGRTYKKITIEADQYEIDAQSGRVTVRWW